MSFGGHVQDMINRDKQNRALRAHIRERLNRRSAVNRHPNSLINQKRTKARSMGSLHKVVD